MLSENLKKYRNLANISQAKIAEQLNISQQGYANYESGKASPDPERLAKIAEILNCSMEDLTGNNKAKQKKLQSEIFTEQEKQIIIAYRHKPEMQEAVNKLLGIEDPYIMTVYKIAESENNSPEGYVPMNQSRWEEMDSKPKTDEDLL